MNELVFEYDLSLYNIKGDRLQYCFSVEDQDARLTANDNSYIELFKSSNGWIIVSAGSVEVYVAGKNIYIQGYEKDEPWANSFYFYATVEEAREIQEALKEFKEKFCNGGWYTPKKHKLTKIFE